MKKQDFFSTPDPLSPEDIRGFQRMILSSYRRQGRDLPWRRTADPYRILVSEFMLQQTQVERVLPKYPEFIALFPDMATLAAAPLCKVLAAWSGLGYNRRAKALQDCAAAVMERHAGKLPRSPELLVQLPGIGAYTARAVCVFAYNKPETVIETNIRAVYIQHFFSDCAAVKDKDLLPFIEITLYRRNPRRWYNALMDYGVLLKKTCANPARRSAGHVRQSCFAGSSRQLRGMIIKILLQQTVCTQAMLLKTTQVDAGRLKETLAHLCAEGLVVKQGRFFRLP